MNWVQFEGQGRGMKTSVRQERAKPTSHDVEPIVGRNERRVGSTTILSVVAVLASLTALGSAQSNPTPTQPAVAGPAPVASVAATFAQPPAPPAPLAPQLPVNLGSAGRITILAKTGISTTGTTRVFGSIGVSPIDSTGITGFALTMDASGFFSRSALVRGLVFAPDYSLRTETYLTRAVSDMEVAYTDAAGRTLPDFTELGAGNIGGMTLTPGLYKWGTEVIIPGNGVVLSGGASDVWIFQIAQDLTVRNGASVTLAGGARAHNVFWQVAGQATLGTTADFSGVILCQTAIVLNTGAELRGRALAQAAVTLDANLVDLR